jgi:hypothetical protein
MNLDFTGSKWFMLFIAVVLPLILLLIALSLHAGICYIFALLTWVGVAIMFFYLPKAKD